MDISVLPDEAGYSPGPRLTVSRRVQIRRVVGKPLGPGEDHPGANIEHQLEETLDERGNKVQRVNKVIHLHHVDK